MKYEISIKLVYQYQFPVSNGRQLIRIAPQNILGIQTVESCEIGMLPVPNERSERLDFFGNTAIDIAYWDEIDRFELNMSAEIERNEQTAPNDLSGFLNDLSSSLSDFKSLDENSPHHFLAVSPRIPFVQDIASYANSFVSENMSLFEVVQAINEGIHRDMLFDTTATDVDTPIEDAFGRRQGVCQDFSHIMIACLRSLRIPAAYVSGFLRTIPPEGQKRLEGGDAMHAWVRVWLGPKMGWIEFDPTNNLIVNSDHIVIGYGRDYSDISPIKGVLRSTGAHSSSQSVDVKPFSSI